MIRGLVGIGHNPAMRRLVKIMTMNQYIPWKEIEVNPSKLFVYGILKRGYELDLSDYRAKFIGEAHIPGAVLYGIGKNWHHEGHPNEGREFHGVGLGLDKDPGRVAHGELWDIPDTLWDWLDQIEQNGFCYTRKVVPVRLDICPDVYKTINSWVYEYTYPGFDYANPIESGKF